MMARLNELGILVLPVLSDPVDWGGLALRQLR